MRSTACPPLRAVLLCATALPLITAFSPPSALRAPRLSSAATPVYGRVGPARPSQVNSPKSCQAAADEPVQSHRPNAEAVAFCCRLKGPAGAMYLLRCGQRRVGFSPVPFSRPSATLSLPPSLPCGWITKACDSGMALRPVCCS